MNLESRTSFTVADLHHTRDPQATVGRTLIEVVAAVSITSRIIFILEVHQDLVFRLMAIAVSEEVDPPCEGTIITGNFYI